MDENEIEIVRVDPDLAGIVAAMNPGGDSPVIMVDLPDSVLTDAEAAYDREDQEWFNALSTETLAAMWVLCCDLATMPSWDDEVYDALYPRGYFEDKDS